MERKIRYVWWGVLGILLVIASLKLFLPYKAGFSKEQTTTNREIVVYVAGAVESPGLVELPLDARLNDALKEVKLLPEANLDQINPAEKLKDGQKILVPFKPQPQIQPQAQVAPSGIYGAYPISDNNTANVAATPNPNVPNVNPSPSNTVIPNNNVVYYTGQGSSSSGLININTADAAELDKLPGIGPALAERIIQYRNEHGPFTSPEDIKKVSGIGPKTYEKMASMVTVWP